MVKFESWIDSRNNRPWMKQDMAVLWNHDKKWSWSLQVVWLRYLSVARWCSSIQDPHCEEELGETCLISCAAHRGNLHLLLLCPVPPCASSAPSVSGYRHVYLEGIEEASIFVHVAINDICGKVSVCAVQHPHRSCQDLVSHRVKVQEEIFVHSE